MDVTINLLSLSGTLVAESRRDERGMFPPGAQKGIESHGGDIAVETAQCYVSVTNNFRYSPSYGP